MEMALNEKAPTIRKRRQGDGPGIAAVQKRDSPPPLAKRSPWSPDFTRLVVVTVATATLSIGVLAQLLAVLFGKISDDYYAGDDIDPLTQFFMYFFQLVGQFGCFMSFYNLLPAFRVSVHCIRERRPVCDIPNLRSASWWVLGTWNGGIWSSLFLYPNRMTSCGSTLFQTPGLTTLPILTSVLLGPAYGAGTLFIAASLVMSRCQIVESFTVSLNEIAAAQSTVAVLSVLVFVSQYFMNRATAEAERNHRLELEERNNLLQASNDALREALQQAEESDLAKAKAEATVEAKNAFLSLVSHEIRTPCVSILMLTDVMLETQLPPPWRQNAEIIRTSTDFLLAILNDLLDLSRLEADRLILDVSEFSLSRLAENCVGLIRVRAVQSGVDLYYDFDFQNAADSDLFECVSGDATRVMQIFNNLVSNALKFTRSGHVGLHLTRRRDGCECRDGALIPEGLNRSLGCEGEVCYRCWHLVRPRQEDAPEERGEVQVFGVVEDTGIGIPATHLDLVFDRFAQVEELPIQRQYGGAGLGLAIVRRLCERMGGGVWAQSAGVPGRGCVFAFWLCFHKAESHASPGCRRVVSPIPLSSVALAKVTNAEARRVLAGREILHCGHSEAGQQALCRAVRNWGAATRESSAIEPVEGGQILVMNVAADASDQESVESQAVRSAQNGVGVILLEPSLALIDKRGSAQPGESSNTMQSEDEERGSAEDLLLIRLAKPLLLSHLRQALMELTVKLKRHEMSEAGNAVLGAQRKRSRPRSRAGVDSRGEAKRGEERREIPVRLGDLMCPQNSKEQRRESAGHELGSSGNGRTPDLADEDEEVPKRLLIVDDNHWSQIALSTCLHHLGYAHDVVGDGPTAIEAVSGCDYWCVLCDVHMPVMDGFETVRQMRHLGHSVHQPHVIGFSADMTQKTIEQGIQAGMNEFCAKPVKIEVLRDVLARVLAQSGFLKFG